MRRAFPAVGLVAASVAAGAAPAPAADPSSGAVSASAPALVWVGKASGAAFVPANLVLASLGRPVLCPQPAFCDIFQLDVVDAGPLSIESSSCADLITQVEVQTPDGEYLFADGVDQSPRTIIDLPAAAPGRYVVRTLVNTLPSSPSGYIGHATLRLADDDDLAPQSPGPTTPAPPTPAPPAPAPPTPAPRTHNLRLTVADVPVSQARRGARVRVRVTSRVALRSVVVRLQDGATTLALARRARVRRTAVLGLRLRQSLGPGVYRVTISARGARGRVTARTRLRVVGSAGRAAPRSMTSAGC